MSDPQQAGAPPPSQRSPVATALMIQFGILLLLPGVCSLVFVGGMALTGPSQLFNFNDPYLGALWTLWIVCFVVAIAGILLLRAAIRHSRASTSRSER